MSVKVFKLFVAVFIVFTLTKIAAADQVSKENQLASVSAFANLPSFSQAKLSPSARKVAYFVELDGVNQLIVQNIDGSNPARMEPPEKLSFVSFMWASDTAILLNSSLTTNRRLFNTSYTENRVFALDFANMNLSWLGEPDKRDDNYTSFYEVIIDTMPNNPDQILMQMDFDLDGKPDVYEVNIRTGKRKKRKAGVKGIQRWMTDQNSALVFGYGYRDEKRVVYHRKLEASWTNARSVDWTANFDIEGLSNTEGRLLISQQNEHGKNSLYELDIDSGELTKTLFSREDVDVGSLVYDPVTHAVIGVSYVDDYDRTFYFDESMKTVQSVVDKALPSTANSITNRARDKDWYLILAQSANDPGAYYIYDRTAKQIYFLANVRSGIDPQDMAMTERVIIPVRDGSSIPAYITTPLGVKAEKLPTVVLPHGGPFGVRDEATWDYWAQFYVNRGYLVLKPNYRGSGGYGHAYLEAGHDQWGGLMQDDITDATKWLIDQGYSDPNRICIVGASYGGYAALMGVIKEPGLYKCAVSVNGVTNLVKLKSRDNNHLGGRYWVERMGLDGVSDKEVSPHHRADEVSAPVLLMSSVDDARIPYKMSRDFHRKLKKLSKDSQYIKIENGTHYMLTSASRMTMLKETEEFLSKHIGN